VPGATVILPESTLTLAPGTDQRVPLFVRAPRETANGGTVWVTITEGRVSAVLEAPFLVPN